MRRRVEEGATLVEALLTLAVLFLILGAFASLAQGYSRILRFSSDRDRALEGSREAVERVRSELAGAIRILQPGPGILSPVDELEFQRVDPRADRLPRPANPGDPVPKPSPSPFNPRGPGSLVTVKYWMDGEGTLWRQVTLPESTSPVLLPAAHGLSGFSARWAASDPRALEVSASFRRESSVRTVRAHCWLRSFPE